MTSVVYPFDTPAGSDVDAEGVRLLAKAPMLVSMDPPRHTRIRALVAKAFSPRTVERLEPRVRELIGGLLDELEAHGAPADLVRLLAEPLPIMVICELLGVPDADRAKIGQWAGVLISETAHTPEESGAAIDQVNDYLAELITARRANPDTALISALIAVNDEGQHLSASELISNVQLLLIAGHETTVSQIGNSIVTLFQHPEQITLLRKQPERLPAAVDELLRHSKLTTSTLPRVVTQDAQVGALGALITRFPTPRPAVELTELDWKTGLSTRSLRALPVTW